MYALLQWLTQTQNKASSYLPRHNYPLLQVLCVRVHYKTTAPVHDPPLPIVKSSTEKLTSFLKKVFKY